MNAVLQSLLACPAFFNMLVTISQNPEIESGLDQTGLLKKLVHVSKFFDDKNQLDRSAEFAASKVNAEAIFENFLLTFNPYAEQ